MRPPPNLIYGVDSTPPLQVTALGALQIIGVNVPNLLLPVLIASQAGLQPESMASVIGTTMLILGVAAALQLFRGRFGSGFPIAAGPATIFLLPGLVAAREGGLALVASMTVLAGVAELVLSRVIGTLRPLFAPEIAGLILILSAMALGADSQSYPMTAKQFRCPIAGRISVRSSRIPTRRACWPAGCFAATRIACGVRQTAHQTLTFMFDH